MQHRQRGSLASVLPQERQHANHANKRLKRSADADISENTDGRTIVCLLCAPSLLPLHFARPVLSCHALLCPCFVGAT